MMVEVTQEDREAAAKWAKMQGRPHQAGNMRRGACDAAPLVQAFARHRIAAEQRSKLEGARLALEAISLIVHDQDRETVAALDPAKIVGEG